MLHGPRWAVVTWSCSRVRRSGTPSSRQTSRASSGCNRMQLKIQQTGAEFGVPKWSSGATLRSKKEGPDRYHDHDNGKSECAAFRVKTGGSPGSPFSFPTFLAKLRYQGHQESWRFALNRCRAGSTQDPARPSSGPPGALQGAPGKAHRVPQDAQSRAKSTLNAEKTVETVFTTILPTWRFSL